MIRRTLLTGVGFGLAIVLAGCLDGGSPSGRSDDGDDTTDGTGTDAGDDSDNGDDTDARLVEEDPRVDEPPYEIDEPDPADDEWNEDFLGDGMDQEPTLSFEPIDVPRQAVKDTGFDVVDDTDGESFQVTLVTDDDQFESVFATDELDEEYRSALTAVDFDDAVVLVVESGFGSSSIKHRWVRVEDETEEADVIHLFGYYSGPQYQTHDIVARHSVVVVDRPAEDVSFGRVSLTIDPDRRVHFNSTEGVVTIEE